MQNPIIALKNAKSVLEMNAKVEEDKITKFLLEDYRDQLELMIAELENVLLG